MGKTWLLDELGKNEYKNYIKINCDNNPKVQDLFSDYDIKRILRIISAISNTPVEPGNTLIFFDEIQELPKALGSLKYFSENAKEYHVVAAGSLLGIKYHQGESFPVGKVDTLRLFPLNFNEFLLAVGEIKKEQILSSLNWNDIKSIKSSYIELLRQYYFTGGMPACVKEYAATGDVLNVRKIQKSILHDYDDDIAKHAPKSDIAKIRIVWNSIPAQLAKENKKFVYGALSDTPIKDIILGNNIFEEYKGAFTEQYVEQQIISCKNQVIHYYTNDNSTSEIDFVLQHENKALPVEVKAEENLRSRSLKSILERDEQLRGLRISMSDYRQELRFDNLPLYAVSSYF